MLFKEIIIILLLKLNRFLFLASYNLKLDLFCENILVLFDNLGFIVNNPVVRSDYASFSEIFQCPCITTLLHIQYLLLVPSIKIDRLHKRNNHSILSMFSCAIQAKKDTQMDGSPFRILFLAINAYLYYILFTLF